LVKKKVKKIIVSREKMISPLLRLRSQNTAKTGKTQTIATLSLKAGKPESGSKLGYSCK